VEKFKIFGEFKAVQLSDLTLLGSPVDYGPAVDAVLESKCEDLARAVSRMALLHVNDALVILNNSLSVQKLLYTLQTAKFWTILLYYSSITFFVKGSEPF